MYLDPEVWHIVGSKPTFNSKLTKEEKYYHSTNRELYYANMGISVAEHDLYY